MQQRTSKQKNLSSSLTTPNIPIIIPENRDEEKIHYWSLRDIPKFEGKSEQPFSHIMEFEDYLITSGVRIEPEEDNTGRRVEVDYKDREGVPKLK